MARPIARALSARLRDRILAGESRAGERLREVRFARPFGAARTPVRPALAPLDDGVREAWRAHGAVGHRTMIEGADDRFIAPTLRTVRRIPSVHPPVLASYDPALLRRYDDRHRGIREGIAAGQGARARSPMRERVLEAGADFLAALHPSPGLAGAAG